MATKAGPVVLPIVGNLGGIVVQTLEEPDPALLAGHNGALIYARISYSV